MLDIIDEVSIKMDDKFVMVVYKAAGKLVVEMIRQSMPYEPKFIPNEEEWVDEYDQDDI